MAADVSPQRRSSSPDLTPQEWRIQREEKGSDVGRKILEYWAQKEMRLGQGYYLNEY